MKITDIKNAGHSQHFYYLSARINYKATTFEARRPLGPSDTSKDTFWPSANVLKPSEAIAAK